MCNLGSSMDHRILGPKALYPSHFFRCPQSPWGRPHAYAMAMAAGDVRIRATSFTSALVALKQCQQWQEALALLEDHDQVPIKSYNTVMGACAKALQWSAALAMLQSLLSTDGLGAALQPDIISFNSAMRACARAWPRSLTLLEDLEKQKLQADVISYSSIMAALPAEAWCLALTLLQQMSRRRVEADLVCFNAAIGACAIAWLQAIAVLEDLQGHLGAQAADIISYNAVLNALGKGTLWQQALHLLQQLPRRFVKTNLVTFNASINCLEQVAGWAAALGLLQQLSQDDLQPDVISFNSSISCQCSWPYALALLADLEEKLLPDHFSYAVTMRSLTPSWTWAFDCLEQLQLQRLRPNAVVHNTLQGALASNSLWSHALHLLPGVDSAEPLMAFSTLLGALERWEMAMGILEDSQTDALVPDVVCFGSALGTAARAEAWREALDMLQGLQLDSVQQNMVIINTLISAMRNHWQWALALLRADLVAYNATLTSCEKGSRWVEALLLLKEVEDVKLTADVITYSAAMSACNQADQWQIALSLFTELRGLRLRPSSVAMNAAINSLGKGKHWTKAIQTFEAMQQGHVAPDVLTFHVASSACNAAAKWRHGATVLRQLQGRRVRCDLLTYHVSMSASASASWWRRSYQSLKELQDAGLQESSVTFNVAVAPCERTGHWQDALHLLTSLPEQLPADVILYNASIDACPLWRWRYGLALLAKAQAVSLADLASYAAVMHSAAVVAAPLQMMSEIDGLAQRLLLTEWDEMKKTWATLANCLQEDGSVGIWLKAPSLHFLFGKPRRPWWNFPPDLTLMDLKQTTSHIQALGRLREWRSALALLQQLEQFQLQPSTVTHNALGNACRFQWQMTLQICGANLEPDLISCNTMLNALATATFWHSSLTLLDAMWSDASTDAFSYNSVLRGLEDQWFRALAVMDTNGFQADLVTFTSVASSCAKALQWQSDVALLSSLQNSATEIDLITFNALSSCFGTTDGWRKCEVLLSTVISSLRCDAISFGAMVSCAAWRRAAACFQRLQQAVSLRPSRVTWNSLAGSVADAQLWLRTFLLLGYDPDAIAFNTAIAAARPGPSSASAWQQCWQCFSQMTMESLRADAFTLTALMSGGNGQVEGGWQRALSLLELPTVKTSLSSLWNAAISCCVDGSAWQCALLLFDAVCTSHLLPDLVTYAGAIAACHQGRQPAAAWSLLEKLEEDTLEPDLVIFGSVLSACAEQEQLLQRMTRQRLEVNLVVGNAVINSCESWEEALASLREFEEQSLRMDLVSYNSVLHACTGCVLWQAGVTLVEEANSRALSSDAVTASTLMSGLGSTGRWRQVLEMTRGGDGDGGRLVLKHGGHVGFWLENNGLERGEAKLKIKSWEYLGLMCSIV
eukprot:s2279_g8.t1